MTPSTLLAKPLDRRWQRAIVLVDMSAFFASVEQLDNLALSGCPVVITNGDQGSRIMTSSHEARAWGIHTGMCLSEAKRMCPDLVRVSARSSRYEEISARIMSALQGITPDIEVCSIDKAFLDVTHLQRAYGAPPVIARRVQRLIQEVSGLSCSVGVAGDKTTAKWAAKQNKPAGLTVIPPWETAERIRTVPFSEFCGVGRGIGQFLASRGVRTCGDMGRLPVSVLAQRWGNIGRRIWLMAQGHDPEPVNSGIIPPKSVGYGNVLPSGMGDGPLLRRTFDHLADKVASRLRETHLDAQQFYIGLRTDRGWLGGRFLTTQPTDDGQAIGRLCREVLLRVWQGEDVDQVQVTALDPVSVGIHMKVFPKVEKNSRRAIHQVVDQIDFQFDAKLIAPASLQACVPLRERISPV